MKAKIPFGYNELVAAITEAIERSEKEDGVKVVDSAALTSTIEKLDFSEVRAKAAGLWQKLVGEGDNAKPEVAAEILKKIEMTMGRRMKLSEFTEDQVELLQLVVDEMSDML
jgi:hypothetical protein